MSGGLVDMPGMIKVGGWDVCIEQTVLSDDDWGLYEGNDCRIKIKKSFPNRQLEVETLLHEINHAIFDYFGCKDGETEERICELMSTGWTMVWRDNPKLVAWVVTQLSG